MSWQLALVEVLGCDGHPGHSRGAFHVVRADGDVCVAFLRNHSTLLLSYSAVAQNNVCPQKPSQRLLGCAVLLFVSLTWSCGSSFTQVNANRIE